MKLLVIIITFFAWAIAASADVKFVFGPDVTSAQKNRIFKAVERAEAQLRKKYSFQSATGTILFASSDTQFLAEYYCKQRGCSAPRKKQSIDKWIFGEAFYRGVMINLSSKQAKRQGDIENAIVHELFHVFQYEQVGSKSKRCCAQDRVSVVGPTWLMEGSADYFQNSMDRGALRRLLSHGKKSKRQLGNLGLKGMETRNGINSVNDGYAIGAYATSLLIKQSGEASIAEFYRNLGRGQNWTTAFNKSFGVSVPEFYQNFSTQ